MTIRYFFVGSSFLRIARLEHPIGSHRLGEFLVVFLGFSQNSSENLQEIHGIQWNHPESHEEIHGSPGVLSGFPPSVLNVERGTAPSEPLVPSGDLVAEANSSALEQCRDRGAEDSVCCDSHGTAELVRTNSLPWKDPPVLRTVNHLFHLGTAGPLGRRITPSRGFCDRTVHIICQRVYIVDIHTYIYI